MNGRKEAETIINNGILGREVSVRDEKHNRRVSARFGVLKFSSNPEASTLSPSNLLTFWMKRGKVPPKNTRFSVRESLRLWANIKQQKKRPEKRTPFCLRSANNFSVHTEWRNNKGSCDCDNLPSQQEDNREISFRSFPTLRAPSSTQRTFFSESPTNAQSSASDSSLINWIRSKRRPVYRESSKRRDGNLIKTARSSANEWWLVYLFHAHALIRLTSSLTTRC